FELMYTVPSGVDKLTFGASYIDSRGDVRTSGELRVPVFADPSTTITGRVIDSRGRPVATGDVEVSVNGLWAEFFDFRQPLSTIPDVSSLKPDAEKIVSAINIRDPGATFGNDPYGVHLSPDYAARFSGWIEITEPGLYQFFLGADEGARLILNG